MPHPRQLRAESVSHTEMLYSPLQQQLHGWLAPRLILNPIVCLTASLCLCAQDEDNYCGFVEFMDAEGGAGWELLEALMKGGTAAGELLRTARFFTPATEASSSTSSSGGGSGGSLA